MFYYLFHIYIFYFSERSLLWSVVPDGEPISKYSELYIIDES